MHDGDHNVFVGDGSGWVAIKEPEERDDGSGITPAQIAYVDQYLDEVDAAMFSNDFEDDAVGWKKYIDVASAVDYYIVMELTKIDDGNMWASTNMYKERDADPAPGDQGKLFFGPMWDYDTSMGYSLEWEGEYQPGDLISPTGLYPRDTSIPDAVRDRLVVLPPQRGPRVPGPGGGAVVPSSTTCARATRTCRATRT